MLELYHCIGARSFRVLWALEELGVPYELHVLPFPPKQSSQFAARNALAKVPLLVDGSIEITESIAILQYLSGVKSDGSLSLKETDQGYADWLNWSVFGEASLTYPISVALHYSEYYSRIVPGTPVHPDVFDYYKKDFLKAFDYVAQALGDREYLMGEKFSLADISIGYNFSLVDALGLTNELPQSLISYKRRLEARQAFKRARNAEASGPASLVNDSGRVV